MLVGIPWAVPNMKFTQMPAMSILQTDTVTLYVKPIPASENRTLETCKIHASYQQQGSQIGGHTISLDPLSVIPYDSGQAIQFSPAPPSSESKPPLKLGIAYYVVSCGTQTDQQRFFSPELTVRIETDMKPTLITPGASTNSTKPLISWQGVANIPAYHVIISDQIISFDEANYTVTGISIVWQAITSETSISYGESDPSGAFPGLSPPPLTPDKKYTLILLNNYDGKSMNATSDKAKEFRIFSVEIEDDAELIKPKLILPFGDDTLTAGRNPTIRFLWTDSAAKANTYSLYIYSEETLPGFDNPILMPVWKKELTDTTYTLDARKTLSNRLYYYKVFAHASSGLTKVSDTASFFYQMDEREVIFNTYSQRANTDGQDTVPLGDVKISITSIDRNQDLLPLVSDTDGWAARNIAYGTYRITFEKSGYLPYEIPIVLSDTNRSHSINLTPVLSEFPSVIRGQIVDVNALVISNAEIIAVNQIGEKFEELSDALGFFEMGLIPGNYVLRVKHPNYFDAKDTKKPPSKDLLGGHSTNTLRVPIWSRDGLSETGHGRCPNRMHP